jgi:hypothetical protein
MTTYFFDDGHFFASPGAPLLTPGENANPSSFLRAPAE